MELLYCDIECIKNRYDNKVFEYFRELDPSVLGSSCRIHGSPPPTLTSVTEPLNLESLCPRLQHWHQCPELHKAIDGVRYIADQTKKEEESTRVRLVHNLHLHIDNVLMLIHLKMNIFFPGKRRLEIRGDGARQTLSVDLHPGRSRWYCWHNPSSANTL